jgi:ATPase family associated with various cellular activities (AAA)
MSDSNIKPGNEQILAALTNLKTPKSENQFESIYLREKMVIDTEVIKSFLSVNNEKLTIQDAGKCDLVIFPNDLSNFKFADLQSLVKKFNKEFFVEGEKTTKYYFQRVYINLKHNNKPTKLFLRFFCGSKSITFTQGPIVYFEGKTCDSNGFLMLNAKATSSLFLEDFNKTSIIYLLQAYAFQNNLDVYISEENFDLGSFLKYLLDFGFLSSSRLVELSYILSKGNSALIKKEVLDNLIQIIRNKVRGSAELLENISEESNIGSMVSKIISTSNLSLKSKKSLLYDLRKSNGKKENLAGQAALRALEIPFDTYKEFPKVEQIYSDLDASVYGMQDVKNQISEFLAIKELNPSSNNQVICLVGEPGVGKTFFVNELSRISGIPMTSIAMGGMSSSCSLKGITRQMQGSMEGQIARSLVYSNCMNPIILLDEIDKIGGAYSGSRESIIGALLEILDPNQNTKFYEDFLNIEIDISKVWFIATANYLKKISPPLLDRLQIINVPNYDYFDKKKIFEHFLLPQSIKHAGLEDVNLVIDELTVQKLIESHNEPGIRKLSQSVKRICGYIALQTVTKKINKKDKIVLDYETILKIIEGNNYGIPKIGFAFE